MFRPRSTAFAHESQSAAPQCPRLLLIEDDTETATALADALRGAGWSVDCAADGMSGLEKASESPFDVLVVDRMLPALDGLSLVGRLRARQIRTPVLFLTAMGSIADRVAGLERGGDDYLVKPFAFAELNARINVLAGRARVAQTPTRLRIADLTMDRLARIVRRGDIPVALLPLEFLLLEFLMLNAGIVVTRRVLLEKVWGFTFDPRTNIVETHISHLRRKIQAPGGPQLIATVRGAGYVISGSDSALPVGAS